MSAFHDTATFLFDPLHQFWDSKRTKRWVTTIFIMVFLAALAVIEFNRQGWLPASLGKYVPTNPSYAIKLAFTLVLLQEVADLIFLIPCSVSKAVGKQLQILSLILVRNTFKELVHFHTPLDAITMDMLLPLLSDGAGALAIFLGLGVYNSIYQSAKNKGPKKDLYTFVAAKKAVALLLLAIFFGVGIVTVTRMFHGGTFMHFFEIIYTVLIFSDILLVLISQRHSTAYQTVFRNSAFAVTTLLIRLALAAPVYVDALIGVSAMAFAIFLTLVYNTLYLKE